MTDELSFLKRRIDDIVLSALKDGKPKFIGFLSEEEIAFAKTVIKDNAGFRFFGGFSNAQRQMLAVYPPHITIDAHAFAIVPIKFSFLKNAGLSHRDFLGAFMSLKIDRKTVGDIAVFDGACYTVATKEAANLILSELNKVKNIGVKAQFCAFKELKEVDNKTQHIRFTVNSNRLDAVVSSVTHLSREKAKELISDGRVLINSLYVKKITKPVLTGYKLTIRGYGKFLVDNCDDISKKGKIIFNISKYI